MKNALKLLLLGLLALTATACGEDDPEETPSNNSTNNSTNNSNNTTNNSNNADPNNSNNADPNNSNNADPNNNDPNNTDNNDPNNADNNTNNANNNDPVAECQAACTTLAGTCGEEFAAICPAEVVEQIEPGCREACNDPAAQAQIIQAANLPCDIVVPLAVEGFGLGEVCQPEQDPCETVCDSLAQCPELTDACDGAIVEGVVAECKQECAGEDRETILATATWGCGGVVAILADEGGLRGVCDGFAACEANETDFVSADTANDGWEACVSDSGQYEPFDPNISTTARIAAFEEMAALLWENPNTPTSEDFIAAREQYSLAEGLGSRVERREDEHYPPATDAQGAVVACNASPEVAAANPERCVGPARMVPIINDAFQKGIQGEDPWVQSFRLEATLLWFLYASVHKEAITCTGKAKDCDSSYSYYTGEAPRDEGLGLSRYILEVDPEAHDRVWDGLLATRCWRDLDPEATATDLGLRNQAVGQLDRALLRGVAKIVIERLVGMSLVEGETRDLLWVFLQILGPALNREAGARNLDGSTAAEDLAAFWELESPDNMQIGAALYDLVGLFPCD
jgi:hypothetical protein